MITREQILAVGFKPPSETFTKQDPRGSEYGRFTTEIAPLPPLQPAIAVHRFNGDGQPIYTIYFANAEEFAAWAKEEF